MSGFLTKVEKRELLALVQKVKDFNLNVAQYLSASSYSEALDLFFKNLLQDLQELNSIYNTEAVAAIKSTKQELREKIKNFCRKTSILLAGHIVEFIKFSDAYNAEETKKNEEFKTIAKEFKSKLTKEFNSLRTDAQAYLNHDTTFDLDLHEDYIHALKFWKDITYNTFITMLRDKRVDWVKPLDTKD